MDDDNVNRRVNAAPGGTIFYSLRVYPTGIMLVYMRISFFKLTTASSYDGELAKVCMRDGRSVI